MRASDLDRMNRYTSRLTTTPVLYDEYAGLTRDELKTLLEEESHQRTKLRVRIDEIQAKLGDLLISEVDRTERDLRLRWKAEDAQRMVSWSNRWATLGGVLTMSSVGFSYTSPTWWGAAVSLVLAGVSGVLGGKMIAVGNKGRALRRTVARDRERLAVLSLMKEREL